MSRDLLLEAITSFLASERPEVLCVTGRWGVGKTYAWESALELAQIQTSIALEFCSYVSLFGVNSLDEIRLSIVENRQKTGGGKKVASDVLEHKTYFEGLRAIYDQASRHLGTDRVGVKALLGLQADLKSGSPYIGVMNRLLFMTIKRQIVCFDDLERAGRGLALKDVLGLASDLVTTRDCKVIILLNSDALDPQGKDDFNDQIEKVADRVISFSPGPEEAAKIALDEEFWYHDVLAKHCTILGLINVRVLRKAQAFCHLVSKNLVDCDARIVNQAIQTIVLATYCRFQPQEAPPISFLRSYNKYADAVRPDQDLGTDPTVAFRQILRRFGFSAMDELDAVLIDGVEKGFFDLCKLDSNLALIATRYVANDKDQKLRNAWDIFHNSFDDNESEMVLRMIDSINSDYDNISPGNLNAFICLLKDLGRHTEALAALSVYVSMRNAERDFWDLENSPFGGQVTDPDVRTAFQQRFLQSSSDFEPVEFLVGVGGGRGWSIAETNNLSKLSDHDFYRLFKSLTGERFRLALAGAVLFRDLNDKSGAVRSINTNVEAALSMIASEGRLNAKRVAKYIRLQQV